MLLKHLIGVVLREAAADDGSDAGGGNAGQQGGEKPPIHDRLKAFLFAPQGKQQRQATEAEDGDDTDDAEDTGELPAKQTKEPAKAKKPAQVTAQTNDSDDDDGSAEEDGSEGEGLDFTTVAELADRTGLTLDRILDLSVSGKVGDKETKASIREMLKSYQTAELLNSKLQTHASEVETWKTQQTQQQAAYQQQLQRMDAGLQVAQRLLQGEFSSINWEQLQATDPNQFAQTLLGFQQRQAMLDQIAQQLGKERQTQQQEAQAKHDAWLKEQKQLAEAKLGWSDKAAREAAIKDYAEVVGKAFGFGAEELGKLTDHRDFLVLDAATKWLKLQASKAGVMNKVRKAPKLLKPGAQQSQAAKKGEHVGAAKAQLKKTGHVKDFARGLRSLGIV